MVLEGTYANAILGQQIKRNPSKLNLMKENPITDPQVEGQDRG
jgi:hypothetical protein